MINVLKLRQSFVQIFTYTQFRKMAAISNSNINFPKSFTFTDYDVIGFDLDNCLCRYNLTELFKLEYDIISKYIIKKDTQPKEFLMLPYDTGEDFIIKGLFLDLIRGNLLRISEDGRIVQASHGTKLLSSEEVKAEYPSKHWEMTDMYVKDPMSIWTGKPATEIQVMTDYFDLPISLVFGRIVDDIDKQMGRPKAYNIFPEILSCLHEMYDSEQFKYNRGGFYPALKDDPKKYIIPCDDNIINWLEELKMAGKILMLLTGSNVDYATFIAENSIGPKWIELFDIKIFKARKPNFWHINRPFKHYDSEEEVPLSMLDLGEKYLEGNYNGLKLFLSKITRKTSPKVVYVGDSILQDIYAPNFYCGIDTVAIIEEVESEGVFGYSKIYTENAKSINSEMWGSYFRYDKIDNSSTVWMEMIKKHARLVAPSVRTLTDKPIDFTHISFLSS